jgi:glycosyltransferase involved in cell wall biosynthesis
VIDSVKYSAIFPARNEHESLAIIIPFLIAVSKKLGEILVVVDSEIDSTLKLKDEYKDSKVSVRFILNPEPGVFGAIKKGVNQATFPYVIICAADEIMPLLKIDDFANSLEAGFGLVSATRYAHGGKRYGGNKFGRKLSWGGNKFLRVMHKGKMTDFTTGFKGFDIQYWDVLATKANGGGWSFALKFSLNALNFKVPIKEIPIFSLDRTIGGQSTFNLMVWVREYIATIFR